MGLSLAALVAVMATSVAADGFNCTGAFFTFFNRPGPMSSQLLDPAMSPGSPKSAHLHAFDGGNGLDPTSSYQTLQDSTCSTARLKQDKSLYWRPRLWFKDAQGYHMVPEKGLKLYYKFGDGEHLAPVSEFPEEFTMIAGDPFRRSDDGNNPGGARWGCHNMGKDPVFSDGFPTGITACDYGLASEISFPACWNGNPLDPANPNAHMAYPTAGGAGIMACPETHREKRFPTIFIEFWYDVSSFKFGENDKPWVLAQGDPTGYGWHADFKNGWEKGVIATQTAPDSFCSCGCACGQEEMEQCFGKQNVYGNADKEFVDCQAASATSDALSLSYDTDVLEALPGCNPIQPGPARATPATGNGCIAAPVGKPANEDHQTEGNGEKPEEMSAPTPTPTPTPTPSPSSGPIQGQIPNPQPHDSAPPPVVEHQEAGVQQPATPTKVAKPNSPYERPPIEGNMSILPVVPDDGSEGGCEPPVYVTVTPTVYVTQGVQKNKVCKPTLTRTVTNTATITVTAAGNHAHKHKRHLAHHKYH